MGLEVAHKKMVAKGMNTEHDVTRSSEDTNSLKIWSISGHRVEVPVVVQSATDAKNQEVLRYLGIFIEDHMTWENQWLIIEEKIATLARILTTARASLAIKWYALSMCGYTSFLYPVKWA
jgi:hypothetical protein